MRLRWVLATLLLAAVVAKKKHRHNKPGRALLDRLSSTTVGEVTVIGGAGAGAEEGALLPPPLDVAPYATVEANATCGVNGAEEFCRDTPGKRVVVCDVCEGEEGSSSRRHPAAHATDGDAATWWQSPTLAAGDYQHVDFVATLPDKMELLHVIIKSGPSPRPLAWSLEVSPSESSDDWRLVRAFGDKDSCKRLWDLRPERRRRKARSAKRTNRADKPTCSTQFASPRPLENGEMHVGVGESVWARRVRVSFRAAHGAPASQQYYTVRALTLAARCLCHGHARHCHVTHEGAKCVCSHGACGSHCQRRCAADVDEQTCACAERGDCSFTHGGDILCVNCTENRAGPLCDKCLLGFYSAVPDGACLPCNCDPEGSDGTCTFDKKSRLVQCACRAGFSGSLCDSCADALAVYPLCLTVGAVETTTKCKCDPRGVVDESRICDDVCECKANVIGDRCDTCAAGHFGLSASLIAGCRPCYCSHLTDSCADRPASDDMPTTMVLPLHEGWLVTDGDGNETLEPSLDDQGRLYLVSYEVEGWSSFYWVTKTLVGDQLSNYGSELIISLFWGIVRGDTGGNPSVGPDVILVGMDDTKLAFGNRSYDTPGQLDLNIPLIEGEWYKLSDDTTPISRIQLMDVLRDVKEIKIRAHFHGDQDEVRIENVELRAPAQLWEQCACPAGYAGAHCSRCAWGHAAVSLSPLLCVPCHCNGHADCHTVNGPCGECQHNTTGPHCERCLPGHYGNPVQGACSPCACPLYLPSNNFSPNCALAAAAGDDYVCTQCPDGYTGDHCENCDFGYWGSPSTAGSRCQPCACGGAPCHPRSGQCLTCPPHAEGARCDQCEEGYWFGADSGTVSAGAGSGPVCVPCACGAGALAAACDARSGQCACRHGWAGRECDRCEEGHGGVEAGCPACQCGAAALSARCDVTTGACACAAGAAPPFCDTCLDEHYGLGVTGCLGSRRCAGRLARERLKAAEKIRDKRYYLLCCAPLCAPRRPRPPPTTTRYQPYHRLWYGLKYGCNCSSLGAESNACDIRTGQCRCRPHVTGRACDTCEEGYWGLQLGACRACACGAGAAACDPVSGACACAPGVGGAHCDHCLPGYYGFGPTGCLPCPTCTDGKICSPDSGRCVCPARSHGPGCRQCALGYYARNGSCVPCQCGPGAVSTVCDASSGLCRCRAGWAGRACAECAPGHSGARCKPCACAAAGTARCGDRVCDCDRWGRCPCKENVVGEKCDTCLEGTFGLSADNPAGCTACFCFGRAARCTQAAVARAALHAPAPTHLTLQRARQSDDTAQRMDQDSLLSIHTRHRDVTISLPDPPVPVYMELDKMFLGDRVTSYGGALRFKVEEEGGTELPMEVKAKFPLVRLYGRHIVLDYYERVPPINGTHTVRLHESLWALRGRGGHGSGHGGRRVAASRAALMLALHSVDAIVLRLTTRAPTHSEHVHALLLNVSLDTAIPGLSRSEPALGVEMCECPSMYSSGSCEKPAVGYWLPSPTVHFRDVAGTIVINLEGEAQPCDCNGRAVECNPNTGECLVSDSGSCETPAVGYWLPSPTVHFRDVAGTIVINLEGEAQPCDCNGRAVECNPNTGECLVSDSGSCETPAVGYWLPSPTVHFRDVAGTIVINLEGEAQPCDCNGRAVECDPNTGECLVSDSGSCETPAVGYWLPSPTVHFRDVAGTIVINLEGEAQPCDCNGRAVECNPNTGECLVSDSGSCKTPAVGYWLPSPTVHFRDVAGTIVINLEGEAQPCDCNGRAVECDPNTGECLNCTRGTGGPRCEVCAEGYHGDPDSAAGCQACPCPSRTRNFASACVVAGDRLQCACKPGYTGVECESCAAGYHRSTHGDCAACACDARGAQGAECDSRGHCYCRPFATGPRCDRCREPRTYLDEGGCLPCDNCTQTLMNSIESLTAELHRRADLTELSRIPKPFPALLEYAHNTTVIQAAFHNARKKLQHSRDFTPLILELESNEHRVFTEANRLKSEAAKREKEARSLSLESMSGLEDVLKQKKVIGEQVGVLDDFARGERHLSAHRALKEARHLLRHIKDIKLIDYIAGANDVSDSANLQSTSIQEYTYRLSDSSRRLQKLRRELEEWEAKAEDLSRLGEVVWSAGDTVAALTVRVRPRLAALRDTGLRCRLVLEDIHTLDPRNVSSSLQSSLVRARSLARALPALVTQLRTLTEQAEEKEGILYNLTPTYREKYLRAVQTHVDKLGEKAREYKSLFAGTRAAASAGVTAARAWSEVADTVRNASVAATQAAGAASTAANMARGPVPMTNTAAVTKAASEDLKTRGAAVLTKAEELRTQLEHLRRGADIVSVVLRGLGWQERELAERPQAHIQTHIHTANEQADRVFATTRVLYDEASEFRTRVRYNLRRQLTELQRHGDTALGAAQEHVSQIRGNSERGAELAGALAAAAAARAREHQGAAATLSPALRALRDNIARARHAAESISVSLTSVGGAAVGCARAYPWRARSGAVSRLALAASFDTVVSDGPLLYLLDDTQETEKYMRLSVVKKRLQLSWDLGGGAGLIEHPELLQPAHDDGDHTSYRFHIERIWNTVHLTVERAGGTPITATNSTAISAISLHGTTLWLGWGGDVTDDVIGLPACVHALYTDDNTIGLWNFNKQHKEAKCTGCTQRWYNNARGGESLVWFNGAGYAELRRSGLRPSDRRQFSISFTVRTRDEDALLFMAVDAVNNRSVSVWMESCRVVFRVSYGGGATLRIAAAGRHCGGRPAHVQAIRVFAANKLERGSLRVNGEETLGSPFPPVQAGAALPDLGAAAYWVGGAPPGTGPGAPGLLGCLGALTVDREGYDLLDTPTRHGVEPRCGSRTLRSAQFSGSGYLELPWPQFRRKAALGLSFRARAPAGLLLLRPPAAPATANDVDDDDDADDGHYLALYMLDGELELVAAAGKAETRLRTNGTRFDDGLLHTLRIVRAHKLLELWVDEVLVSSGSLAGNAYPARAAGLFLGGAPRDSARLPQVPATGFTGTLADLIVDSSLIGFETAVNWSGARLGRADSEPRTEAKTHPRALHAQPDNAAGCTKASSYTVEGGAVKFGDALGSHAVLRLPPRGKELVVSLQFRTFATDGLLLYSPGTKAKPKHYLALLIREGKLQLALRGRKRKQLALAAFVADGTWRSVSVRVSRGRLVLAAGGAAATAHAPPAARAPRLYVGGYPAPAAATAMHDPRLPNAIAKVGGFRGCIRRVTLNGRAEDLVRNARAHHRVGQCFPSVERGAYFTGDSYASWTGTANVESSIELRLQFRTDQPAGVLLATTDFVLELRDGTLVLSGPRTAGGGGGGAEVRARGPRGSALCDSRWHFATARLARAAPALRLDDGPQLRGGEPTLLHDDDDTPVVLSPLYIGGVPEGTFDSSPEGRENFKGCIRDVTVGGHNTEWTKMETLHNVLLDSCPIA